MRFKNGTFPAPAAKKKVISLSEENIVSALRGFKTRLEF